MVPYSGGQGRRDRPDQGARQRGRDRRRPRQCGGARGDRDRDPEDADARAGRLHEEPHPDGPLRPARRSGARDCVPRVSGQQLRDGAVLRRQRRPRDVLERNREQGTGNREQGTRNREQGTGNKEQGTSSYPRSSTLPAREDSHCERSLQRSTRARTRPLTLTLSPHAGRGNRFREVEAYLPEPVGPTDRPGPPPRSLSSPSPRLRGEGWGEGSRAGYASNLAQSTKECSSSLFPVPCSLFLVPCSLFPCSLLLVTCYFVNAACSIALA